MQAPDRFHAQWARGHYFSVKNRLLDMVTSLPLGVALLGANLAAATGLGHVSHPRGSGLLSRVVYPRSAARAICPPKPCAMVSEDAPLGTGMPANVLPW